MTIIRKWGIYRSLVNAQDLRDEAVLFANFSIEELQPSSTNNTAMDNPLIITPNPAQNIVHLKEADANAGGFRLKNANVRWFLSVNYNYIPDEVKAKGLTTFRSITVDGEEIEFSGGFTDLHTRSYEEILKGNGFGLDEAYGSISTVSTIRNLDPIGLKGEYHPFCKKIING